MENEQRVSFDDELLIVVDEDNRIVDYRDKLTCHLGEGILHRAFSIFIFNRHNELLLQQRSSEKMLWPLFWSNSCCSHPRKGEDLDGATRRRLQEELGIRTQLQHVFTFRYHARFRTVGSESEICAVYIGRSDAPIIENPSEIAAWKYVGIEELSASIAENPEAYSPWMKMEWQRLMQDHLEDICRLPMTNDN